MRVFLSTVMHSGTTWLIRELTAQQHEVDHGHCCENRLRLAREWDGLLATTYRDPYRIAASWANRGHLRHVNHWYEQWKYYGQYLELKPKIFNFEKGSQHGFTLSLEPANTHDDLLGLHKALDEGDWDHFWRHVPRELMGAEGLPVESQG